MVRPGVQDLLRRLAKHYEIVVYTASLAKYANPLLDILDPDGHVSARLFREHCAYHSGSYVKDLAALGRSLSSTLIVDNSPTSYMCVNHLAAHRIPAVAVGCWVLHEQSGLFFSSSVTFACYNCTFFLAGFTPTTEFHVQTSSTTNRIESCLTSLSSVSKFIAPQTSHQSVSSKPHALGHRYHARHVLCHSASPAKHATFILSCIQVQTYVAEKVQQRPASRVVVPRSLPTGGPTNSLRADRAKPCRFYDLSLTCAAFFRTKIYERCHKKTPAEGRHSSTADKPKTCPAIIMELIFRRNRLYFSALYELLHPPKIG